MISLDSQTPKFGKSLFFAQSVLSTHGWLFAGREYYDLLPELLPKKITFLYLLSSCICEFSEIFQEEISLSTILPSHRCIIE